MVGRGAVGDGHPAVRDHDDRHDRAGVSERDGAAAAVLRAADRDDHPVGDAGAVLPQRARLYRLRVPRKALRLEDAHLHGAAVPVVARHGDGRRHLGPGGRAVGDDGHQRHDDVPRDRAADRRLHDVRRRAGGDLDRREADVPHRLRPAGSGDRADAGPAGERQRHRCPDPGGRHRPPAGDEFQLRPERHLHVLVGHARRRCSCSCRTSAPTRARCSATSRRRAWTRRARRC